MNFLKSIFFVSTLVFVTSCSNNSPVDLQESNVADVVTYKNTVKSIIDSNCINCHGAIPTNGAPMSLDTYAKVRASVLTQGTIDRMTRNIGDPLLMPLGASKLPQSKIDAIIKWQTQGFQD